MSSKTVIGVGLIVTLLLAAAVGGLYLYGQKKMIRDSANQFAAATTVYERAQWPEAEHLFGEIVRKYPKSEKVPDSLYYLAMMMQAGGRYAEAVEKWQALAKVENNAHAVEIDYYSAYCHEMLGEKDKAGALYTAVAANHNAGDLASLAKSGLGRIAEGKKKFDQARRLYEEAINVASGAEATGVAEGLLGALNLRTFLIPVEDEEKEVYTVRPGDSMVAIAIKKNTTVDLLCKINGLSDPTRVRPNQRLIIPKPGFSILIDKSDFKLTLYNHGRFFKSYKVGLGKHGCTPLGEFVINDKIKNPTWWSPHGPIPPRDPRNELGTRWMALKPLTPGVGTDYGIHGTIDPSTIGWESSNGCPRMFPKEAEELYMLVTLGTPVTIQG